MRRLLLAISIIALLVMAYGCQWLDTGTAPETASSEQIIDLDSPTGGFTFTDEEPAFGEAELFEPMFNEIAVNDSTADSTQVKELFRHRNVKIFRLRSIWGHLISTYEDTLETRETEYCPVDWSGMMKLEGGAILIERIIAFDEGDCVSRDDVGTISWTSWTGPHIDGLQVMLVVPWGPEDSTETYVEPKLLFETGPFSRLLPVWIPCRRLEEHPARHDTARGHERHREDSTRRLSRHLDQRARDSRRIPQGRFRGQQPGRQGLLRQVCRYDRPVQGHPQGHIRNLSGAG